MILDDRFPEALADVRVLGFRNHNGFCNLQISTYSSNVGIDENEATDHFAKKKH